MLSFAVGGLLGDVFLHLLPEACDLFTKGHHFRNGTYSVLGYWVLFGMATFILIQMIFTMNEEEVNFRSASSVNPEIGFAKLTRVRSRHPIAEHNRTIISQISKH